MGVLNCDRPGCENIMCDRHSHKYGYICFECFDELLESDIPIEAFMKTEKGSTIDRKLTRLDAHTEFPFND